jgi:hypothetical protein
MKNLLSLGRAPDKPHARGELEIGKYFSLGEISHTGGEANSLPSDEIATDLQQ